MMAKKGQTIGDLQDREKIISGEIFKLIREFELDYNIEVYEVHLKKTIQLGSKLHQCVNVELEIKL